MTGQEMHLCSLNDSSCHVYQVERLQVTSACCNFAAVGEESFAVAMSAVLTKCLLRRGFETQWDVGFDEYEVISRQVPTMVSEGNHETDWPGRRPVGASDRWANTAMDSGDNTCSQASPYMCN